MDRMLEGKLEFIRIDALHFSNGLSGNEKIENWHFPRKHRLTDGASTY